jgi:hypothetical protein
MTWKEFKEKIEPEGVEDDSKIWIIDIHSEDFEEIKIFENGDGLGFYIL